MKTFLISLFLVGFIFTIAAADDAKDEAIKKDRQQIEGTWRVVELIVDGNPIKEEDAKKFTVVNGSDGTWSLRSEEKEISKGTSTFDPTQKPKYIDFKGTEDDSTGMSQLGIYELRGDTRRMCFAEPGKDRPSKFSSEPDSGQILVKFERVKSP